MFWLKLSIEEVNLLGQSGIGPGSKALWPGKWSGGVSVSDTCAQCNWTGSRSSLQLWICCNTSGGNNVRYGVFAIRTPTRGLLVVEVCL